MLDINTLANETKKSRQPVSPLAETELAQIGAPPVGATTIHVAAEDKVAIALAAARARKNAQLDIVRHNIKPAAELVLTPAHTVFVTGSRGLSYIFRSGKKITFNESFNGFWAYKTTNTVEIGELSKSRYVFEWDVVTGAPKAK